MSDTPETVDVRAVPTLKGLRHYLDYQYPPTRGDVLLNKFCNKIAELESERNEAMAKLKNAYNYICLHHTDRERSDLVTGCPVCKLDQLRKEVEELETRHAAMMLHTPEKDLCSALHVANPSNQKE